ncbi:hypothetical protein RchiOBHm_Chr7g0183281 [Rosa chinensis]|uniref:Uncharacterized protein n=1 Tax=Rosa chinensis TaxID=74649 RepID=A0A2P6P375_ROSCH|nr:hypothetical protein RchiOBHm_Chr7g0183281 [Rosa chinensis]
MEEWFRFSPESPPTQLGNHGIRDCRLWWRRRMVMIGFLHMWFLEYCSSQLKQRFLARRSRCSNGDRMKVSSGGGVWELCGGCS